VEAGEVGTVLHQGDAVVHAAPLATATQDTEDSIDHLVHVGGAWPSTRSCVRNERRQHSPLGIGQICRISCQNHSRDYTLKWQMHFSRPLSRQALREFAPEPNATISDSIF
jgi:hypothetical protein